MQVLDGLKKLGLTEYESKIYLSLMRFGELKAKELSEKSNVPYSKTYEITSLLEKKGLIEAQESRPMIFRALPPAPSLKRYTSKIVDDIDSKYKHQMTQLQKEYENTTTEIKNSLNASIDLLQGFYENMEGTSVSDSFVWTFKGKENIVSQIRELISSSNRVKVILHNELFKHLKKELPSLYGKADIILQISGKNKEKLSKNPEVHLIDDTEFEFSVVISDDKTALFATKNLDIAFKSSNIGLVTILDHFFEHEREEATINI